MGNSVLQSVFCAALPLLAACLLAEAAVTGKAASPAATQPAGADVKKDLRILFVGNSYTQVNSLQRLVPALLSSDGRKVHAGEYLFGGKGLKHHWNHNLGILDEAEKKDPNSAARLLARKGQFDKLLKEGSWDYVVLQGHSRDALTPEMEFPKHARLFAEKIRQADPNTKVLFYLTWARQNLPDDQAAITRAYADAARENNALAAPVGEAWKAALAARPGLVLHAPDKSHPNVLGTYLAGCVFYSAIAGKSPEGLPGKIESIPAGKDKGQALYDLKQEDAKFLQEIAWRAVRQFREEMARPGTPETQKGNPPGGR